MMTRAPELKEQDPSQADSDFDERTRMLVSPQEKINKQKTRGHGLQSEVTIRES